MLFKYIKYNNKIYIYIYYLSYIIISCLIVILSIIYINNIFKNILAYITLNI